MEELLTPEAAQEDTELWIDYFGRCVQEVYQYFSEPVRDMYWQFLDQTSPKQILRYFLSAVNLDPINEKGDQEKRYLKDDLNNNYPVFGILENLKIVVQSMYAYARGENISDGAINYASEVISWYVQLTEKLSPMQALGMRRGEEALENFISPRFAYAYKMFRIRLHLTHLMIVPTSGNGISPPDLATVAGVAYTYIIKLIKTKKLTAYKSELSKNWIIPGKDAINWLTARPNCPKWVHQLLEIKPIRIEDYEIK